jgi:hypothetical protein
MTNKKVAIIYLLLTAFLVECVLLWGLWFAGELLWDLDSANIYIRILGYAGIYGHFIPSIILDPFIVNIESANVILLVYGITNWIVIALCLGFACWYIRGRYGKK